MMPEETPNKADELLKRYAKERRGQAGDFSLHPATRRLLQGEVTRTFGRSGGAKQRSWFTWLGSWNGRLAFGTAAAAVVVTGFLIAWNSKQDRRALELAQATFPVRETQATRRQDRVLAEKEVTTVDTVALADAPASATRMEVESRVASKKVMAGGENAPLLANGPAAAPATRAGETFYSYGISATNYSDELSLSLKRAPETLSATAQSLSVAYFDGSNLRGGSTAGASAAFGATVSAADALSSVSVANAASGAPKQPGELEMLKTAPALAASGVEPSGAASRARTARPNSAAPVATAPPTAVATAPAAPPLTSLEVRNSPVKPQSLPEEGTANARFSRSAPSDATKASDDRFGTRLQRAATPVLANFTIEQTGQTVRIVDADGSVYDGTVELPPRAEADFDADARRADKEALVREKLAESKVDTAPRHQEITFRAAGSNVTLRQTVMVSGRIASTNSALVSGALGGVAGRGVAEASKSRVASELRTDTAARRSGVSGEPGFSGRYRSATNAAASIEGTVRIGATNQQWFRAVRQP